MEIKYDPLYEEELSKCVSYALLEFGRKTALAWHSQALAIQRRLNMMPESYPPAAYFRNKTIIFRGALIMKNFKIIYFYNEKQDVLWIVDLWDLRQDPRKLRARARKIVKKTYH